MTIYEILISIIVGLIGAIPLFKLGGKVGADIGGGGFALLVLLPIIQLPFLYYIAFKKAGDSVKKEMVISEEDKQKKMHRLGKAKTCPALIASVTLQTPSIAGCFCMWRRR